MGAKYREYQPYRGPTREERQRIHPIWRGVGCALIILIPVIAYAATEIMVKQPWMPLPVDLLAGPGDFLYGFFPDALVHIKAISIIVLSVIIFAVVTFVSFLITSMFGVSNKNDPYYVAPVQRRRKRRY